MSANWNNVRQAVYVLGAGVLGAAAAMGWITADQGEQLTDGLVEALGAITLILAAANTNKGHKPASALTPAQGGSLPVYDGPTSAVAASEPYVGRHRSDG